VLAGDAATHNGFDTVSEVHDDAAGAEREAWSTRR